MLLPLAQSEEGQRFWSLAVQANRPEQLVEGLDNASSFWVEKGARKHWENMLFVLATPYGPGLKTRLRKTK